MEERAWGACLEGRGRGEREASRGRGRGWGGGCGSRGCEGLLRASWARARAPKERVDGSSAGGEEGERVSELWGSVESSSEMSLSVSGASECSEETSEGEIASSSLRSFLARTRCWKIDDGGMAMCVMD